MANKGVYVVHFVFTIALSVGLVTWLTVFENYLDVFSCEAEGDPAGCVMSVSGAAFNRTQFVASGHACMCAKSLSYRCCAYTGCTGIQPGPSSTTSPNSTAAQDVEVVHGLDRIEVVFYSIVATQFLSLVTQIFAICCGLLYRSTDMALLLAVILFDVASVVMICVSFSIDVIKTSCIGLYGLSGVWIFWSLLRIFTISFLVGNVLDLPILEKLGESGGRFVGRALWKSMTSLLVITSLGVGGFVLYHKYL